MTSFRGINECILMAQQCKLTCDDMSKRYQNTDENGEVDEFPVFDLSWDVDDIDDPSYVTVFDDSRSENITRWISTEKDHAVNLEDVR